MNLIGDFGEFCEVLSTVCVLESIFALAGKWRV